MGGENGRPAKSRSDNSRASWREHIEHTSIFRGLLLCALVICEVTTTRVDEVIYMRLVSTFGVLGVCVNVRYRAL